MNSIYKELYEKAKAVGRDKNLSLQAKGMFLVLRNTLPITCDMHTLQEKCNNDNVDIYAAITELADAGYISFNEVKMYLGHSDNEKK